MPTTPSLAARDTRRRPLTREETIIAFARLGYPPREIRMQVGDGLPLQRIHAVLRRARANGVDLPNFRAAGGRVRHGRGVVLDTSLYDRLMAAARPRGLTANEIARRLLSVVLIDGLVDAVLDDAAERATCAQ